VDRQVFRDLLFRKIDLEPPPPPFLLGIERFGAPDYPPSTYETGEGVRVVRRIQLLDPGRGRRRAGRGHESELPERSGVGQ
jgi:hypothetical protein